MLAGDLTTTVQARLTRSRDFGFDVVALAVRRFDDKEVVDQLEEYLEVSTGVGINSLRRGGQLIVQLVDETLGQSSESLC